MNNVQNVNCFDQLPNPSMKYRGDSLENDLVASRAKRMTGSLERSFRLLGSSPRS